MIPLNQGTIFSNLINARKSTGSLRKKTATLLRFSTFTQPSSPALQPQRVNTARPITGIFHHITAKDALNSGGYFVVGDIMSNTEVAIQGASNVSGAIVQPDRLVFESFTYQVEGKPERVMGVGGRLYTKTLWRKV